MNREEELLATLGGEIVKRDARIDHKDLAIVNLQSALASARNDLAALKAQPSGVVLPERRTESMGLSHDQCAWIEGWNDCIAKVARLNASSTPAKFHLGDRVRKTKGSQWSGVVVGTYSTALTPEGYAVESSTETGSVQIYPAQALEVVV